jgi:hypothetical protein
MEINPRFCEAGENPGHVTNLSILLRVLVFSWGEYYASLDVVS